jgi:nucleoside 2-deoxyribosyltransferase
MRIYVASSWRNKRLDEVVAALRGAGHQVYDFREDGDSGAAFNWSDIDPQWQQWSPEEFRDNLEDPIAARGFNRDMDALANSEALLLVLPCGRSAHLELGYAIGARKPTVLLLADGQEPELMYKAVDELCLEMEEVLSHFDDLEETRKELFKTVAGAITKLRPA